jgi:hypothetical protein
MCHAEQFFNRSAPAAVESARTPLWKSASWPKITGAEARHSQQRGASQNVASRSHPIPRRPNLTPVRFAPTAKYAAARRMSAVVGGGTPCWSPGPHRLPQHRLAAGYRARVYKAHASPAPAAAVRRLRRWTASLAWESFLRHWVVRLFGKTENPEAVRQRADSIGVVVHAICRHAVA